MFHQESEPIMNIFALHQSPQESARAHCDQHLHKMLLESAQMVSTVFHHRRWNSDRLYKPAYQTHPCTIWAGANNNNLRWLIVLARELENIRQELGHPYHSSSEVIKFAFDFLNEETPRGITWAADPPALAMPIHIKMRSDINSYGKYQEYYKWKNTRWTAIDKRPMTWKNRPVPSFMNLSLTESTNGN